MFEIWTLLQKEYQGRVQSLCGQILRVSRHCGLFTGFEGNKKEYSISDNGRDSENKKTLYDLDNTLNYRDRTVGALLMYTGLRSCDIANLKMQVIHWKDDIITIYQQKTSVALTLPLRAVVGNPIFDYITKKRPQSKDSNLFVSESRPPRAISSTTVSTHIEGNIFNVAGVRMRKSGRRSSHIFRHLLAITLLENGIPQPVISSTSGHINPDSTETYLSADLTHLKECGINITNYPISEEVFNGKPASPCWEKTELLPRCWRVF